VGSEYLHNITRNLSRGEFEILYVCPIVASGAPANFWGERFLTSLHPREVRGSYAYRPGGTPDRFVAFGPKLSKECG
jgi:hypothetical protein